MKIEAVCGVLLGLTYMVLTPYYITLITSISLWILFLSSNKKFIYLIPNSMCKCALHDQWMEPKLLLQKMFRESSLKDIAGRGCRFNFIYVVL